MAQYLWLRLLAQGHKNICCVGDDDQSIYGWRGAEVGNILRFEKDFPGAKVIRLEQNYRSTPHILAAASGLIACNEGRLGKTLWTDRTEGEPLTIRGVWDGEEEARVIGDEIEALQRKGHKLDEIAILVRAGFQTREFEERFITLGLPYRVIGGPRFYEREEIRDAIAYLRVIHQQDDDLALERIINKPTRGIGKVVLQAIHALARAQGIPLYIAAIKLVESDELRPAARRSLGAILEDFERWRGHAATMPHIELAEIVLDESGYTAMWQNSKKPEAPGKLENLKELISALEEFENLAGFLEHVSLVMENAENSGEDMVSLMTLAQRQGPGIRYGLPARLGGGAVPPSALARRERPRRAGGRAPARLCRHHPCTPADHDQLRREPAHPQPVAERHSVALRRRAAAGPGFHRERQRALRQRGRFVLPGRPATRSSPSRSAAGQGGSACGNAARGRG